MVKWLVVSWSVVVGFNKTMYDDIKAFKYSKLQNF